MEEQRQGNLLDLLRSMEEHGIAENDSVRHKIYGQVIDRRARAAGYPRFGVFELTPLCNLDCKMCYVHLKKEQMQGQKLLSGKEWIALMKDAVENGMMEAQLSGGEAMMHPDFDEIYRFLYENGIRTTVMTNGILLHEGRIDFFRKYPPASLQVTLYGADEATYEKVTGSRKYHTVASHLILAKEIGCRITVSCTPSRYFGADDVRRASVFCKEHDLRFLVNSNLNEAREETGRAIDDFNISPEEHHRVQEFLAEGRTLKPVAEKDLPPLGNQPDPAYGIRCAAGRAMFCVKWTGAMQICLDIEHSENPFEIGFAESWKRLHEYAKTYEIPRECIGCAYSAVCTVCPVQHAIRGKQGHVDRRICERTRRLVREGYRALPKKKEDDANCDH